jgi:hypothetical protein
MSSFSDYAENAVLNHVFRNVALTSPTTVYLSLHTTPGPSDAGSANEITAVGNYVRMAVTFGAPAAGVITNSVAVSWTNTGTNYGTIVSVGIWDALSGGNMLAWDGITSAALTINDVLNFNIGQISVSLT